MLPIVSDHFIDGGAALFALFKKLRRACPTHRALLDE
jgi:hypothetical protein